MSKSDKVPLPSLTALKAFEVVGRLGSVTHAAEQLYVTQSAVSRQILALEREFGCRLFVRERSGVRLTEIGRDYHRNVSAAMHDISKHTTELKYRIAGMNIVRVTILPTMAMYWLVPQVARFKLENPAIAVDISSSNELADLEQGSLDVGIRLGSGNWPNLRSTHLFDEFMITVCSPSVNAKIPDKMNDAMTSIQFLHTTTRPNAWDAWLEGNNLEFRATGDRLAGYQDFFITIQAAILGHGVAVVPAFLVEQEIANGRLVDPFQSPTQSERSYYFVTSEENADRSSIVTLREWLVRNALPNSAKSTSS
jgi:LysR family glycine cleavage system transcriptional activator